MLVRYVCQSVRKRASVKRKKRRRDVAREREAARRRVFEKLKKNRGGVYRSRGWKNFSDGGF